MEISVYKCLRAKGYLFQIYQPLGLAYKILSMYIINKKMRIEKIECTFFYWNQRDFQETTFENIPENIAAKILLYGYEKMTKK
jgi:hypothetical protein